MSSMDVSSLVGIAPGGSLTSGASSDGVANDGSHLAFPDLFADAARPCKSKRKGAPWPKKKLQNRQEGNIESSLAVSVVAWTHWSASPHSVTREATASSCS
eukprot:scaffold212941_cov33-Prasinocladus_malaysianus.AAC.1